MVFADANSAARGHQLTRKRPRTPPGTVPIAPPPMAASMAASQGLASPTAPRAFMPMPTANASRLDSPESRAGMPAPKSLPAVATTSSSDAAKKGASTSAEALRCMPIEAKQIGAHEA
jgi:hypothetical protein